MRIDEELYRRFSWVTQFETDLGKVEDERREMVEGELTTLLEALVATAHLLPPQLERLVETEAHQVRTMGGWLLDPRPDPLPPNRQPRVLPPRPCSLR